MTINHKLFHLGNDVVAVLQKIEEHFPAPSEPWKKNMLKEVLVEILRIVNIIRMEAYQSKEAEKQEMFKKSNYKICSKMSVGELEVIHEDLKKLGVRFEIYNEEDADPMYTEPAESES